MWILIILWFFYTSPSTPMRVGIERFKSNTSFNKLRLDFSLFYQYFHWYLFEYSNLHQLHCTWFECIRSCTKHPSYRFFTGWWVSQLVYILKQSIEIIIHYLIIRWITCLGHRNEFPIVSALVCMIIHWIGAMMNHDIGYQVVMID